MGKKPFRPTEFIPEDGVSVALKIAQMLDWAAIQAPGTIVTYPQIAKVIMSLGRMPRQDAKEVDMVRSRVSSARQKLIEEYERDLVSEPGIGCRATFSDADAISNCVTKRTRRLLLAKNRLVESINILSQEGMIAAKSDIPQLVEWLNEELKPLLKSFDRPKNVKALEAVPLSPQE
jgi:hypothetical protein